MFQSWTAWVLLVFSIATTLVVWGMFLNIENQAIESEFNSNSNSMTHQISNRLDQYEQVLKGASGFLSTTSEITPQTWKNFVVLQGISNYPDVQGVGFTEHVVGEEELNNLVTKMQSFGVEDFSIVPEGRRDEYYPVVFMEPLNTMNKRAIGYDTYFEDSRKAAVNSSIESGEVTISGKIILVQEMETEVQNGFLLMMPVFSAENGLDRENDSSSVLGMVNAVFRINDFVDGVIGEEQFEYTHLKIYDGSINPNNLFFDSDVFYEQDRKVIDFSTTQKIEFTERSWILVYEGVSPPLDPFKLLVLFLIPIAGLILSGLLFYIFYLSNKNLQLVKNSIKVKKFENIGKLAAVLAHDLRNPLSVANMSMMLLSKYRENSDEKNKNLISKAKTSLEKMTAQINDVVNYVQTGELNLSEVSFKELINIPEVLPEIPSNVTLNLPQNDLSVRCDKQKIQILLSNLIANAVQAIGENTGSIAIRLSEERGNAIIEIEDSGPGISKENMKKVFEPLFTTKISGTGLGLASCKNIVDSHKGRIKVSNNPTKFRITLPKK